MQEFIHAIINTLLSSTITHLTYVYGGRDNRFCFRTLVGGKVNPWDMKMKMLVN